MIVIKYISSTFPEDVFNSINEDETNSINEDETNNTIDWEVIMARKGPVSRDVSSIALGLAQIRVGPSLTNIGKIGPVLAAANSIGSLASTVYRGNTDWYKLEGGFPLIEEMTTPIREAAALECSFREINPKNLALLYGIDSTTGYDTVHSGEIKLGARISPASIRMEAAYTFPDGTNFMYIVFPRAQVSGSAELPLSNEDAAAIPMVFESKNASSDVTGGHAVWDNMPLGRIVFTEDEL